MVTLSIANDRKRLMGHLAVKLKSTDHVKGRNWGGGGGQGAPPSVFYTLVKDMSLYRGAAHFTIGLMPCIILSFLL